MIDYSLTKLFKLGKYHGFPDHVVDFVRRGGVYINGTPITDMKYFEYDYEKNALRVLDHVWNFGHNSSSYITIQENK